MFFFKKRLFNDYAENIYFKEAKKTVKTSSYFNFLYLYQKYIKDYWCDFDIKKIDFSEETKINELNLDFNNFLNKIKNYPKNELCLSEKMLLEKELEGATYEYLSKKYDIEIPRIQKNIYAAKTLLRKKFKEQVKYLKEVA